MRLLATKLNLSKSVGQQEENSFGAFCMPLGANDAATYSYVDSY